MRLDYLLRLFEWNTQMAIAVSQKRETGGYGSALEEIEKACLKVTGLSFRSISRYSPEELFALMKLGADTYLKSIFLADLLIKYAEISKEEGKVIEELRSTLQAYFLLSETIALLPQEVEAAYQIKLQKLIQRLSCFKSDPYVRDKLAKRLEMTREY